MKKYKILQIGALNSFGGIETFQINLFRHIDKNIFQVDFTVGNLYTKFAYEEEINKAGGKVFYLPTRRQGLLKRHIIFRKILNTNNYDVIHINVGSLYDSMYLYEALKSKCKKIILHGHSSKVYSKLNYFMHQINKVIFSESNIKRLACSNIAGQWLHWDITRKNVFEVINNGIDVDKYRFNSINRNLIRRELNIGEKDFVIGNVARLTVEKNHKYILAVFSEFHRINKDSKLLLVGDGKLRKEIENIINEKGLDNCVILVGQRNDIPAILSAMDCFVLPSVFEGFPITVVESQANGLKTIVSSNVTEEVCLSDLVVRLSINVNDIAKWVEEITKTDLHLRSQDYSSLIKSKGFDLKSVAQQLEQIYKSR